MMRLRLPARMWLIGVSLVCIAVVFLYFAGYGIHAYFTSDDLMNLAFLHGYFTTPIPNLLLDVLNPWGVAYRPLGGTFYRAAYGLAGLNPLPLRCSCFVLLLSNLYLVYRFSRVLTGSVEAALLAALFISYNPAFSQLYYNTGTIYDLLAFASCMLGITWYAATKRAAGHITALQLASLAGLTILALQAKEIGCLLPAGILLDELWHAPSALSRKRPARLTLLQQFGPAAALGALTVATLLHRLLTPNLLGDNPAYRPTFSLHGYLQAAAYYQGLLFYSAARFTEASLLWSWAGAGLLAAALKSRNMAFALSFWIVGLVPVCLIPPREGYVLYLPAAGVALYLGLLGSRLRHVLSSAVHRLPTARSLPAFRPLFIRAAFFGIALLGMTALNQKGHAALVSGVLTQNNQLRLLISEMARLHVTMKPGAQMLFRSDPFPADDWLITYAMRLLYRDPAISVDRAKKRPHARSYDYVFEYGASGNGLVELPPVHQVCGAPGEPSPREELLDDASPRICWQGSWVSANFPKAFSQTVTFSSEPGAKAIVSFAGTRFVYLYTKAPNRGMALLTIDGAHGQVIDLYAADVEWQSRFGLTGLTPGLHTAEVSVLNTKQLAAAAATIDVDGFIVQ